MLAASESVRADRVGKPVNVPVDDANDPVIPEAIEVAPVETPIEVSLTVASVEPVVDPESVDPVAQSPVPVRVREPVPVVGDIDPVPIY